MPAGNTSIIALLRMQSRLLARAWGNFTGTIEGDKHYPTSTTEGPQRDSRGGSYLANRFEKPLDLSLGQGGREALDRHQRHHGRYRGMMLLLLLWCHDSDCFVRQRKSLRADTKKNVTQHTKPAAAPPARSTQEIYQ